MRLLIKDKNEEIWHILMSLLIKDENLIHGTIIIDLLTPTPFTFHDLYKGLVQL
jgi:hypothetical protein